MKKETVDTACRECGLLNIDVPAPHRCGVPILREAIGLELADKEEQKIGWLAGWGHDTVDTFANLFRRVRADALKAGAATAEEVAE